MITPAEQQALQGEGMGIDIESPPTNVNPSLERAQAQWKNLFSRSTVPTESEVSGPRGRRPSFLTRSNHRENNPWGDILIPKAPNYTQVYVQNGNGLSIDRRRGQLNDVCAVIQEVQADVFCGQEHNLDVTQMSIRSILYDTVKQYWNRTKFIAGTTPIPFMTPYKPGGGVPFNDWKCFRANYTSNTRPLGPMGDSRVRRSVGDQIGDCIGISTG